MAPADQLEGVRRPGQQCERRGPTDLKSPPVPNKRTIPLACSIAVLVLLVGLAVSCGPLPVTPQPMPTRLVLPPKWTPTAASASNTRTPTRTPVSTRTASAPSSLLPPSPSLSRIVDPAWSASALSAGLGACGAISMDGRLAALQGITENSFPDHPPVTLWSLDEWTRTWSRDATPGCVSLAVSPDDKMLASATRPSGLNTQIVVEIRMTEDGEYARGIADYYFSSDLAFTPDGKSLIVAAGSALIYTINNMPRFSENVLEDRSIEPAHILSLHSDNNLIVSVEPSPSGSLLALGTTQGDIAFWAVGEQKPRATVHTATLCDPGDDLAVVPADFSPDGSELAVIVCGHDLAVLDIAGYSIANVEQLPVLPFSVSFSPNGRTIAASSKEGVLLWDATNMVVACQLDANQETATSIGFSADGNRVFATTLQGSIMEWSSTGCSLP